MKLKYKIGGLFLLSTTISVGVFCLFFYYVIHIGYFGGISGSDMLHALETAGDQLEAAGIVAEDESYLTEFVNTLDKKNRPMLFTVKYGEMCVSGAGTPQLSEKREFSEAVNGRGEVAKTYKVRVLSGNAGGREYDIICYVNYNDYETISYAFNPLRGKGVLGKIALIGVGITVLIMMIFLWLFGRRFVRRVTNMYQVMQELSTDHMDVRMEEKGNDELAVMAEGFNSMAEKLEKQYQEKSELEQKKRELVSVISHDLRTPLSSVMGYAEMLCDGIYESKEEQRQYADIIRRKSVYMEKLLTELLEYSRLEMGTMRLCREKIDLTELVREILIEYYPQIEKNGYELELKIPEYAIWGEWDAQRIGRVIRNLIENALKYGMDGKKLTVSVEKERNSAVFQIRDYGKGVSREEIPYMADLFYRGDSARNSKTGGMGLGLYIANEIICMHMGKMVIESGTGEGFMVKIILPLKFKKDYEVMVGTENCRGFAETDK